MTTTGGEVSSTADEPPARATRELLDLVGRAKGVLIAITRTDGTTVYASPSIETTLGVTVEEFCNDPASLMHPEDFDESARLWEDLRTNPGREHSFLVRARSKEGGWRRVQATGMNVVDRPDIDGVLWLYRDLTDELYAQEQLSRGDERYHTMLEHGYDGFVVVGQDQRIAWASERIEQLLGVPADDAHGMPVLDFVHPDDQPAATEALIAALDGAPEIEPLVLRLGHLDGSWRWFDVVGADLRVEPTVDGYLLCLREVTHRHEAELARRATEERFRVLVQHSSDVVLLLDAGGMVTFASPASHIMFGHPEGALVGTPGYQWVHPDDAERLMNGFIRLEEQGSQVIEECRVPHADGSWRWVEAVVTNLLEYPAVNGMVANIRDVTERRMAEEATQHSIERFRALVRNAADVIVVLDTDGRVTYVSPEADLFARPISEVMGANVLDWVHPDDLAVMADEMAAVMVEVGSSTMRTFRILNGQDEWRWIEATVTNMVDNPSVDGIVANIRDITTRVEAERNASRLLQIFEATSDQVGITDPNGKLLHVNAAARRHLGIPEDAPLPEVELLAFFPEWERDRIRLEILPALLRDHVWTGELEIVTPGSTVPIPVLGQFLAHRDSRGTVEYFSAVLRDITERKAFEAQLEHEATHDPLTELPNRTLLLDRLTMAVARARRHGTDVAVLFLDLDHFKVINDSHGHSLGDELLAAIAERISGALRPDDTVARFGGDEFVVLCEELRNDTQAMVVGKRILDALQGAFDIAGTEIFVGASVGVSSYRQGHGEAVTPETLLREADAAMYRAKDRGRGQIAVFDETLRSKSLWRLDTETALRHALQRDELLVHYQPIIDLHSGRVHELEALVRWKHPDRGMLLPDEFIQIAEETGLIVPMGAWVLEQACQQLAQWRTTFPDLAPVRVAVNLSGRQLSDKTLVEDLERILTTTGVPADLLILEITESLLMDDVELSHQTLAELRKLRVKVAVDDFGTGYSSLSYLRTFAVDVLKIDRSFVSGLGSEGGDEAIVAAIIRLAHTLGLEAVAEGVESEPQLGRLQALGCDRAQGFYFARPAPAEEIAPLLGRIMLADRTR